MKSILDPSFKYTKSVETDLRKTFARVRKEQRQQEASAAIVEKGDSLAANAAPPPQIPEAQAGYSARGNWSGPRLVDVA